MNYTVSINSQGVSFPLIDKPTPIYLIDYCCTLLIHIVIKLGGLELFNVSSIVWFEWNT